jgi:hypothetical protein
MPSESGLQSISLNTLASTSAAFSPVSVNNGGAINISTVLDEWFWALNALQEIIAPDGMISIFNPCLTYGGLSSLRFVYQGMISVVSTDA